MTAVTDTLQCGVDKLQDELLLATQALVREKSENPPGDVTRVADRAADLIQTLIPTAKVETYDSAPGIKNVVAVIEGNGEPGRCVLFSGHLDTYPVGDISRWSYDPFGATMSPDGQKLYGRGVSDMKGGIAASIIAASVLALHHDKWAGRVVLAFAGDEETMGTLGSDYLLENVNQVKNCHAMICGDAGSPTVVRAGEKGFVWIEVVAQGKGAHGAHVHKGDNAIDKLMKGLLGLKELEKMQSREENVNSVIQNAKGVSEGLGGQGEADVLQRVTVNIGRIEGGTSTNLVAESAKASLDIRIPFGVTVQKVLDEIEQRLEGLQVTVLRTSEPSWTPQDSKIVQHTLDAAKEIVSKEAVVNMRVGASDSRLFRRRDIPSVVLGLTPYNMGGPDEYVEVKELQTVAKVHVVAAFNYLTQS